jgi:hypothetical protein
VGQRRLGDPELGVKVGLHGRVELLGGDVEDRRLRLLEGCVADQDVEPAQALHGAGHEVRAEGLVADVAGDGHGPAARGLDQRDHLGGVGLPLGQVVDRHVGALAGKGDRRPRGRCRCRRR